MFVQIMSICLKIQHIIWKFFFCLILVFQFLLQHFGILTVYILCFYRYGVLLSIFWENSYRNKQTNSCYISVLYLLAKFLNLINWCVVRETYLKWLRCFAMDGFLIFVFSSLQLIPFDKPETPVVFIKITAETT